MGGFEGSVTWGSGIQESEDFLTKGFFLTKMKLKTNKRKETISFVEEHAK